MAATVWWYGPPVTEARTAKLLAAIPLFSCLSDGERSALAATELRARKGALVVAQGASADALYAVVSGTLRVSLLRAEGGEAVLGLLGPGDLFGELGMFRDDSRSAQVKAIEPSLLVVLRRNAFRAVLARSAPLAVGVCELLAGRVRQLTRHFDEVTGAPVERRLARKLLSLADRFGRPEGDGVLLEVVLSQEELGRLAETSRQSVNRLLQAWRAEGLLGTRGRRLVLRRLPELRGIAGLPR